MIALGAAALAGSCARYADEVAPDSYVTAALLSGGIALGITLLFFVAVASWRRARLVAIISLSSYLVAAFGSWFLLGWPMAAAIVISVAGGIFARSVDSATTGGLSRAVMYGFAILVAGVAVVVGFWVNYDPNFGGFFGSGGGPSTLNVLPFALITGIVPPVIAILVASATKEPPASTSDVAALVGPETKETRRDAATPPAYPQPTMREVALLLASVGICAMMVKIIHPIAGIHALSASSALFHAGLTLVIGAVFLALTPDRREIWFFAVIGVAAFILAEFVIDWPARINPWGILPALTAVVMGGRVAAHATCSTFGVGAGQAWRPVAISMLGAFVAGLFSYWATWTPFVPPFFGIGWLIGDALPLIMVAAAAHMCGQICRRLA